MDLTKLFTGQMSNKMNWGEAIGLWDIARFKITGLTISEIFIAQANDTELKDSLNTGIEMLIIPHIEKIQRFMHKEGLQVPSVPQRKNLDIIGKKIEPNTIIEDDEIANNIREIYRFGLSLDLRGLAGSMRDDVRKLIHSILNDDINGFDAMIKLHRKKNWLIPPGTI